MSKIQKQREIANKKAEYLYHLVNRYTAGLILKGTEVKSLRLGQASMSDAYCTIEGNELIVRNLHIAEYKLGTDQNHEPLRVRKLLLRKDEIRKIHKKIKEKGMTIVPVRIFFSERGHAKMEIAVAKGKKTFDKRESIRQKDNKRDMDRLKKNLR